MASSIDLVREYPNIFKRISLDEVDIIARGEQPKHRHYIYLEDLNEIIDVIKNQDEEEAIKLIARKIHSADIERKNNGEARKDADA